MRKRPGDNAEKYLVVKMTERQKKIVQLKASMAGLPIDDYVIKTINNEEIELKQKICYDCQKEMSINKGAIDYPVELSDGKEHIIKILNYPRCKCSECGVEKFDLTSDVLVDKLIDYEIMASLNNRERPRQFPKEIDFNEMIKM